MHKLQHLLAASLVAGLAFAPVASAQKIGFVDVNRLLAETPQARTATQALETEFGPRQKQLEQQRKDLEARLQKFERDQPTMAEAERNRQQRELRDAQVNFERRGREFQEDFQQRQNEELQKLQRAIAQEVQSFARAQGYDIVLAQGVLYRSDSVDITAQVLQTLQSKGGAAPAAAAQPKPAGR